MQWSIYKILYARGTRFLNENGRQTCTWLDFLQGTFKGLISISGLIFDIVMWYREWLMIIVLPGILYWSFSENKISVTSFVLSKSYFLVIYIHRYSLNMKTNMFYEHNEFDSKLHIILRITLCTQYLHNNNLFILFSYAVQLDTPFYATETTWIRCMCSSIYSILLAMPSYS